jgi:hypothetical protein
MTNEEILNTPDALLTGIDRQKKFILLMALERCRCPVCGAPSSLLDAAGISLNDYPFAASELSFKCPAPECGVALQKVVPLMAIGRRCWLWMRKY